MLGLGLRLGAAARRRFSPRALFANGEQGAWYDPSDLGTLFQDVAGTLPAVLGGPVGRINDKSGRGNHAGQGGAALRPTLRQDGNGRYYLEFDGVDDRLLTAAVALDQPWDRVCCIRQTNWANGRRIFAGSSGTAGLLQQAGTSPALAMFDGTLAPVNSGAVLGAAAVIAERHSGATSSLAVNGGAASTGNPGTTAASGIALGCDVGGFNAAAFHFYGLCVVKGGLGAAALAALKSYYAAKGGVAL
jgi:hypothetical protein